MAILIIVFFIILSVVMNTLINAYDSLKSATETNDMLFETNDVLFETNDMLFSKIFERDEKIKDLEKHLHNYQKDKISINGEVPNLI